MRWWAMALGVLLGMLLLAGCSEPPAQPPVTISLLTFRYDHSRNMALALTRDAVISPMGTVTTSRPVVMKNVPIGVVPQQPYSLDTTNYPTANPQERQDYATVSPSYTPTFAPPIGPLDYANALAGLPEMSIAPSMCCCFNSPIPTVCGKVLTVNYSTPCDPGEISEEDATPVLVSMEAWWWVPYICDVHLRANCEPLTELGPFTFHDPWEREYHTYLVQRQTGEVGYEFDAFGPQDLMDALQILAQQDIGSVPAMNRFYPADSAGGILHRRYLVHQRRRAALRPLPQFPARRSIPSRRPGADVDAISLRQFRAVHLRRTTAGLLLHAQ